MMQMDGNELSVLFGNDCMFRSGSERIVTMRVCVSTKEAVWPHKRYDMFWRCD